MGQNAMDLVIFYSVGEKPCLTYYINNESAGYKIEFPFAYIKNITLDNGIGEDGTIRPAGLIVELNRAPNFFMDSAGSNGFFQCGDFTEDQQASRVLTHHLGGDPRVLSGQLAKLTLLESFQNRLNPYIDTSAVAASAPVSPVGHRPSSQPSAMVTPQLNMFQDHGFGMSLHPHARGHKRTRSRSVPAIVDFGMLRQPTPSFHVQHPSTSMTDHSIWAPAPQHHHLTPHAHDLRINTAAGYDLDYRQYPMSAATTTSPSEFASPGFFASSGAHMDQMPASSYNGGYSLPYLSPMPEHPHLLQQSISPLSGINNGDPVIADHSPPLSNLPRSQSADFLTMSQDHRSSMDEGLMLSEMYSKQSLNLPIRTSTMDDTNLEMHLSEEPSNEEMDMHTMLQFVDPSNLSPGNIGM